IALCLDQLTEGEAWPFPLSDPEYADGRRAIAEAIDRALEEDARGAVSDEAVQGIKQAVDRLHQQCKANSGATTPGYAEGEVFLKALSGLAGMLHNPSLEPVLKELETYEGGTVGELIAFMQHFNLRFG